MGFKGEPKEIFKDDAYGMKFSDFMRLSPQERAKLQRNDFPLTDYTGKDEPKVSIWGKLLGYDANFSSEQIDEFKKFLDDSGMLGVNMTFQPSDKLHKHKVFAGAGMPEPYSADEFIGLFGNKKDGIDGAMRALLFDGNESIALLDSDMSIEKFKEKWSEFARRKRAQIAEAKNADAKPKEAQEANKKPEKFKPIQATSKSVTYKDEAKKNFFDEFVRVEAMRGTDIWELLRKFKKLDMKA